MLWIGFRPKLRSTLYSQISNFVGKKERTFILHRFSMKMVCYACEHGWISDTSCSRTKALSLLNKPRLFCWWNGNNSPKKPVHHRRRTQGLIFNCNKSQTVPSKTDNSAAFWLSFYNSYLWTKLEFTQDKTMVWSKTNMIFSVIHSELIVKLHYTCRYICRPNETRNLQEFVLTAKGLHDWEKLQETFTGAPQTFSFSTDRFFRRSNKCVRFQQHLE